MTDETILLTYDELADRLGIERESARQLVLRKRWNRRKGNDGRARIEVPLDALPLADTSDAPSHDTGNNTSDDTDTVRILTRHIERLEQAIEKAEKNASEAQEERDVARDNTRAAERATSAVQAQLDELKGILETEKALRISEREKADGMSAELRADRDRWHQQTVELQKMAARPWWRRLAG